MNLDLQKVLPVEAFETEQNEGDYIGKDGLVNLNGIENPNLIIAGDTIRVK